MHVGNTIYWCNCMEGYCMIGVELKDVSFSYATAKRKALEGVSFKVEKGSLCAIVGANGSGKTTICNLVRGFAPHFYTGNITGQVLIHGDVVKEENLNMLGTQVGFIFQNPFVQISGSTDTVYEEVAFGLENLGVEVSQICKRVEESLRLTGIEHLRDNNPAELSGGQKQRVALCAILAMDPDIYVIDEPTSQLDPQGTEDIFRIIKLLKDQGKTIILVEHKIELIAEYADQIIVLDKGKLVYDGTPSEIFSLPDLISKGVSLPCYAQLGLEMRGRGFDISYIPIVKDEAIDLFKKEGGV